MIPCPVASPPACSTAAKKITSRREYHCGGADRFADDVASGPKSTTQLAEIQTLEMRGIWRHGPTCEAVDGRQQSPGEYCVPAAGGNHTGSTAKCRLGTGAAPGRNGVELPVYVPACPPAASPVHVVCCEAAAQETPYYGNDDRVLSYDGVCWLRILTDAVPYTTRGRVWTVTLFNSPPCAILAREKMGAVNCFTRQKPGKTPHQRVPPARRRDEPGRRRGTTAGKSLAPTTPFICLGPGDLSLHADTGRGPRPHHRTSRNFECLCIPYTRQNTVCQEACPTGDRR